MAERYRGGARDHSPSVSRLLSEAARYHRRWKSRRRSGRLSLSSRTLPLMLMSLASLDGPKGMSHESAFREVQRFRQRWLWAVVVGGGPVSAVAGGPAASSSRSCGRSDWSPRYGTTDSTSGSPPSTGRSGGWRGRRSSRRGTGRSAGTAGGDPLEARDGRVQRQRVARRPGGATRRP